jgi:hypothetical protein
MQVPVQTSTAPGNVPEGRPFPSIQLKHSSTILHVLQGEMQVPAQIVNPSAYVKKGWPYPSIQLKQ